MDTTEQNTDSFSDFVDDLCDFSWKDVGIGVLKASVWIACAVTIILIDRQKYDKLYMIIPIAIACLYTVYFCFRLKGYIKDTVNEQVCRLGAGVGEDHEEIKELIKNTIINLPRNEINHIEESQELEHLERMRDNT